MTGTDSSTLSHRVYEVLRDEITHGRLEPGERLVRRQLSRRLGVSPIPVIEALLRLERDGLVESEPQSGARVRTLDVQTLEDEQVLREALECQVARLLAERGRAAQFNELAALAGPLDRLMSRAAAEPGRSELGIRLHMEFHLRMAEMAGSAALMRQLRAAWYRHQMQLYWINNALAPLPANWHKQLVAAVRRGDPDTAEAAMRDHVRHGLSTLAEAARRLEAQQLDPFKEESPRRRSRSWRRSAN